MANTSLLFQFMLAPFEKILANKRILVTGHTGFTGSWTCLWLKQLGADIGGLALAPDTQPSLYQSLNLGQDVKSTLGDIRDYAVTLKAIQSFQPEAILHLAAQPLVRQSYREPLDTFATNAMGTAHVLEAARQTPSVKAVVCATTDKVYANTGSLTPYREGDALGGKDPYSASKAAAEMIIAGYAASFHDNKTHQLAIAAARGGNIIGGGDWSEDRIVPDYVRAVTSQQTLTLRNPDAVRPWQHVLALVQGYLMLLAGLLNDPSRYSAAWNFGPQDEQTYNVRQLFNILSTHWTKPVLEVQPSPLPEAKNLSLDSTKARDQLAWMPLWNTEQVLTKTATWYRDYYANPKQARSITEMQLQEWRSALSQK